MAAAGRAGAWRRERGASSTRLRAPPIIVLIYQLRPGSGESLLDSLTLALVGVAVQPDGQDSAKHAIALLREGIENRVRFALHDCVSNALTGHPRLAWFDACPRFTRTRGFTWLTLSLEEFRLALAGKSSVPSGTSPARNRVTQLVAEGDTVVGLGTSSWNRNGSGEPAEVKSAHVWTLADGKITRFQQHVDTAKERYLIA